MQIISSVKFTDDERNLFEVLPRVGHIAFPTDHLPEGTSGPDKKIRASDPNASVRRLFTRIASHNEPFAVSELIDCLEAATRLRDELADQARPDWWLQHARSSSGDTAGTAEPSIFASNPIPVLVEARQVMAEQVGTAVNALEVAVAAAQGSVPVGSLV